MDDMEKDLQEFDLDDILKEFGDSPEPEEETAPSQELVTEEGEDLTAPEEAMEEVLMAEEEAELPDGQEEAGEEVSLDETLRFAPGTARSAAPDESAMEEDTQDLDALLAQALEEPEEAQPQEQAPEQEAKILYNPRTRLRELKKKLVAGPERRYYELSEKGVGRLQMAILVNVIIVALCALTTWLYATGKIPENRLRLTIFSQVLAMLVSAFLGCNQILDGLGDLFTGKFNINSLLAFSFAGCCVDAFFCLNELRVPCCAAFSLEITLALQARYHRYNTELAQMDTLRKAVRLNALVRTEDFLDGKPGLLRRDGEVEDFMDTYTRRSGPEKVQSVYSLIALVLCFVIAMFSGMTHGVSMGVQIFSTALLVAVPAGFFIAVTRPMAVLEKRLHMVGTVLCGWQGVKALSKKAAFPIQDSDLFPQGSNKLNGVKFYSDRNSDEVVAYSASLIFAAGGSLTTVFQQLLSSRGAKALPVTNFQDYGTGGVGGEIGGEPVLMGSVDFLRGMGIQIPEGSMVNQAVYCAIDGKLCAVYAISYAKMRSATAGLVTLCGTRKVKPVLLCDDFMLTESFLMTKFEVKTRRLTFLHKEQRQALQEKQPSPKAPALALATREDLISYAYAVTGSQALVTSTRLGTAIGLIGGILGLLTMAALGILGNTELLTPLNVLLYQIIWLIPGWLITEWTRAV